MMIQIFPSGPLETNAYLAICPTTKDTAIIDPASNSFSAIQATILEKKLNPVKILITHSHWDHIADAAAFKKHYNIPLFIHPLDVSNLEHPGSDGLPFWIDIEGVSGAKFFQERDKISVGNLLFEVIHTPGHTPGGVCFYAQEQGILFSGDTLFKGSIGNLSFPTCNSKEMWKSLDKLAKLPPETKVYPGHGPYTTIKNESWLPKAEQIFGDAF